MIIDTHAHINNKEYELEIDGIIYRARKNNVLKIIAIGSNLEDSKNAILLSKNKKEIYASIGIHPESVDDSNYLEIEELVKTNLNNIVAIGEIGIDLYWRKDNFENQKTLFLKQIELAIKYNLPVIIHTRNSIDIVIDLLEPFKHKVKGVFHCFGGSLEQASKIIDLGFMIGLGGIITFKNSNELREVIKSIDINDIIIETDSPYLAPTPFRGKRNEPSYVIYVLEELAKIKNISLTDIEKKLEKNTNRLFNLEDKE